MPLHLIKLCVGADSIADLANWQAARAAEARKRGGATAPVHITRMTPKRTGELLDGGSLYWVIKGQISARQRLTALESFTDEQGIGRCRLVLDPAIVSVAPRPFRPFQGWRYLRPEDAPEDLRAGAAEMPEELRRELGELGLL